MKSTLLVTLFWIISVTGFGQKIFSEGNIKYDVFLEDGSTAEGIYVISVKGGLLKRELAMNNGFNNVTIYNQKTGKTLSLNAKEEQKYALEISEEELKEKNKRFENAKLDYTQQSKKIAGYACKSVTVTYSGQQSVEVFYTPDLVPQNESFNTMFPGLKGIPLEYETKVNGNKMRFVASLVEIKVLESNQFAIPASYKIVTKEELKQLK